MVTATFPRYSETVKKACDVTANMLTGCYAWFRPLFIAGLYKDPQDGEFIKHVYDLRVPGNIFNMKPIEEDCFTQFINHIASFEEKDELQVTVGMFSPTDHKFVIDDFLVKVPEDTSDDNNWQFKHLNDVSEEINTNTIVVSHTDYLTTNEMRDHLKGRHGTMDLDFLRHW